MYYKLRCNSTQFVIYYRLRNYYKLQRNNAVEPALNTTLFKRPPVYKDDFKFLPIFFPLKWTWFQGPPV